jgi:hypothetical protein
VVDDRGLRDFCSFSGADGLALSGSLAVTRRM